MNRRFFIDVPVASHQATLTGSEARHLMKVLRAKPGDEVTLFDGTGREYRAEVIETRRSDVRLRVVSRSAVDRESPVRFTLGVALPRGDGQRWLLEKAVELGVARVVPLLTDRGVARPKAGTLDRLRRAVIEASKQCGRNRLLEIATPATLDEFASAAPESAVRWIAHPGRSHRRDPAAFPAGTEVYAAVGPEGGFTEEELAGALAAGWQPIGLGRRILRVETAALALAARIT